MTVEARARAGRAVFSGNWLSLALASAGTGVLALTAITALLHLGDRFFVSHVTGAWIALTYLADQGVFYPPLFDGQHFGGTRYMPLGIALQTLAAKLTGEYVVSAKVFGALCALTLVSLTFRALLRVGASRALALALLGSIAVGCPGQLAAWSVRGDVLPLALQLAAVGLLVQRAERLRYRHVSGAALLCGLAVLAKSTAVWAVLASAAWLMVRARRLGMLLLVTYASVVALGLWSFDVLSGGRMIESLSQLTTAGIGGIGSLLKAPFKLDHLLIHEAVTLWATLPFATLGVLHVADLRGLHLYQWSLAAALAILLVVLADDGAMQNHLLDLAVLAAICAALTWRSMQQATLVFGTLLLWTVASGFAALQWPNIRGALTAKPEDEHLRWLSGLMQDGELVLSEDPLIPVLHRQRPIVVDAYMLPAIARKHPEWIERGLVARIARREFQRVILLRAADPSDAWYAHHLGPEVVAAVRDHYREQQVSHGYYVYTPR